MTRGAEYPEYDFSVQIPNVNLALKIYPVHIISMRANINLDTDAYSFASAYANGRGIPLGAAVSELLRQREQMPAQSTRRLKLNDMGYLVAEKTEQAVTPEMVKQYSEDDLD
jgi:hypothetical protein